MKFMIIPKLLMTKHSFAEKARQFYMQQHRQFSSFRPIGHNQLVVQPPKTIAEAVAAAGKVFEKIKTISADRRPDCLDIHMGTEFAIWSPNNPAPADVHHAFFAELQRLMADCPAGVVVALGSNAVKHDSFTPDGKQRASNTAFVFSEGGQYFRFDKMTPSHADGWDHSTYEVVSGDGKRRLVVVQDPKTGEKTVLCFQICYEHAEKIGLVTNAQILNVMAQGQSPQIGPEDTFLLFLMEKSVRLPTSGDGGVFVTTPDRSGVYFADGDGGVTQYRLKDAEDGLTSKVVRKLASQFCMDPAALPAFLQKQTALEVSPQNDYFFLREPRPIAPPEMLTKKWLEQNFEVEDPHGGFALWHARPIEH